MYGGTVGAMLIRSLAVLRDVFFIALNSSLRVAQGNHYLRRVHSFWEVTVLVWGQERANLCT